MTHMIMMKFAWQRNPVIFQNVSLKSSSNIGSLTNSRKCQTNTKNRKKLMNPHTAGKKSFAVVCKKLEKDKEIVSQKEVFVATRTRKSGRLYKASNENTMSKIAEMEKIEKEMSADGQSVDAFSVVMGPEHPGRFRLYGLGVTKTSLKKKRWQFCTNFK